LVLGLKVQFPIRLKTALQSFYRITIIFILLEIYYENPDQGSDANPSLYSLGDYKGGAFVIFNKNSDYFIWILFSILTSALRNMNVYILPPITSFTNKRQTKRWSTFNITCICSLRGGEREKRLVACAS